MCGCLRSVSQVSHGKARLSPCDSLRPITQQLTGLVRYGWDVNGPFRSVTHSGDFS